jgi:tripartite-type tricarboxylate transporter receptor subunit TctC
MSLTSREQFGQYIRDESNRWSRVIREAGIARQ